MGEIDQVLARAYASKGAALPSAAEEDRTWRRNASRFSLPTEEGASTAGRLQIRWPSTVEAIEREHGHEFEELAEVLLQRSRKERNKVLLFTSCHRAEGRTTLVLTLARVLARKPARTILVEADLGGPTIARLLGIRPLSGLEDVVEDGVAVADALIDVEDHLAILPLKSAVTRPRDFLAGPGWSCLMAKLRREFDLVLLDGGPLFVGLSVVLHRSVDAAVLVRNGGLTNERSIDRAREVLEAGGVPLLGVAETFV